MKTFYTLLLLAFVNHAGWCSVGSTDGSAKLEMNKKIASGFYENLWFNDHTDRYQQFVAEKYVVYDIGDRKGVTEPAAEQKNIADFFWKHGEIDAHMDYQVAENDLVANRWIMTYHPKTLFGKIFLGENTIPIINVFRIKDGKIVEIWNHRHDIDTNQTLRYVLKGLLIGLLIALVPTIVAFRLRRKLKRIKQVP